MERLTSNKPVDEMSMVELAHNCCYAKDRIARYRDFEMDMDARDFARNLMTTLTDDELPLDDDDFDEEVLENLIYDPFSNAKGLIALFYRNLWAMADLRERLKQYEDAEEQGLLLRLPCKVGDTLHLLYKYNSKQWKIKELTVKEFVYRAYRIPRLEIYFEEDSRIFETCLFNGELNENLFLTREEAEQALKQMGE